MAVDIENTSKTMVLVTLNSGASHYLAPGEKLRAIEGADVNGNARIRRLVEQRLVAFAEPGPRPRRSRDMSKDEAIEHIRTAPRAELGSFLSDDENRVSVRRALEDRQAQ